MRVVCILLCCLLYVHAIDLLQELKSRQLLCAYENVEHFDCRTCTFVGCHFITTTDHHQACVSSWETSKSFFLESKNHHVHHHHDNLVQCVRSEHHDPQTQDTSTSNGLKNAQKKSHLKNNVVLRRPNANTNENHAFAIVAVIVGCVLLVALIAFMSTTTPKKSRIQKHSTSNTIHDRLTQNEVHNNNLSPRINTTQHDIPKANDNPENSSHIMQVHVKPTAPPLAAPLYVETQTLPTAQTLASSKALALTKSFVESESFVETESLVETKSFVEAQPMPSNQPIPLNQAFTAPPIAAAESIVETQSTPSTPPFAITQVAPEMSMAALVESNPARAIPRVSHEVIRDSELQNAPTANHYTEYTF